MLSQSPHAAPLRPPGTEHGPGRSMVTVGLVALAVAIVAGLAVAVAGFVLFESYRPAPPSGSPSPLRDEVRSSLTWTDRHERWSWLALGASAAAVALLSWVQVRGLVALRRSVVLVVGAAAVLGSVAPILTRPLVQWQQLGLREVMVGTELEGYRAAAFDDQVRFVLVDGAEVSPGEYVTVLVGHLAAPLVAVAALLVLAVVLWRAGRSDGGVGVGGGATASGGGWARR